MRHKKDNYKVYVHINKINGKIYIGQTCMDVNERWRDGKGYCKSPRFYYAIQEYGWDNFEHIVLIDNLCEDEANIIEKELIKKYNSTDINFGYNASSGGDNIVTVRNIFNRNKLKEIMKNQNISYRQLFRKTGVGKSTLQKIATFQSSPTQEMMVMIAKGLNMKVTDIFDLSTS